MGNPSLRLSEVLPKIVVFGLKNGIFHPNFSSIWGGGGVINDKFWMILVYISGSAVIISKLKWTCNKNANRPLVFYSFSGEPKIRLKFHWQPIIGQYFSTNQAYFRKLHPRGFEP